MQDKTPSWRVVLLLTIALTAAGFAQEPSTGPADQPAALTPPAQPLAVADMSIPELYSRALQARDAGQLDDAVRFLLVLLQKDEKNKEALGTLGDLYWSQQNAELARKYWLAVLDIQRSDFGANFGLGRMYLQSGIVRNAARYLEVARRTAPPDRMAEVLVPLAQALSRQGKHKKALDAIQRALTLEPDNIDARFVLVSLRSSYAETVDDFDRADAEAQRLIEVVDNDIRTNGMTLNRLRKKYSAYDMRLGVLSSFRAVLFDRNPDGTLSDRLRPGMEKAAAGVNSRVVETKLQQEDVRRILSYFDVIQFAKKAVEYDGGRNPETLLTLALLQEKTGQLDAAYETFQNLQDIDPDNETARKHLESLRPQPQPSEPPDQTP